MINQKEVKSKHVKENENDNLKDLPKVDRRLRKYYSVKGGKK